MNFSLEEVSKWIGSVQFMEYTEHLGPYKN